MAVREGELRLPWGRVLPKFSSGDRIGPSSLFFSYLGGNSMLLMKLQAAIKETMSVTASTRVLYQASTMRNIVEVVDKLRQEQAVDNAEHEIDWLAELAVRRWLAKQVHESPASTRRDEQAKTGGIEVMMTGASGFLGGHLLRSLVRSKSISKVHCIAVLPDDEHLVPSYSKVEC
jgi:aspyridone synthetase (hybrid polyketide synthase/nonribosomal peptide synthetase)